MSITTIYRVEVEIPDNVVAWLNETLKSPNADRWHEHWMSTTRRALRHLWSPTMNRSRARLAALALTAACWGHAQAQLAPSTLGLHLHSFHDQSHVGGRGARGWNDGNVGVYARWANGLTVGAFRNSLFRNSKYVGWTFSDARDRFALTVGAVDGYDRLTNDPGARQEWRCNGTCRFVGVKEVIQPMLVPSVRVPLGDRASARIALLASPGVAPAVDFMLEMKL